MLTCQSDYENRYLPHDPDLVARLRGIAAYVTSSMQSMKVENVNTVRFLWGGPTLFLLDRRLAWA